MFSKAPGACLFPKRYFTLENTGNNRRNDPCKTRARTFSGPTSLLWPTGKHSNSALSLKFIASLFVHCIWATHPLCVLTLDQSLGAKMKSGTLGGIQSHFKAQRKEGKHGRACSDCCCFNTSSVQRTLPRSGVNRALLSVAYVYRTPCFPTLQEHVCFPKGISPWRIREITEEMTLAKQGPARFLDQHLCCDLLGNTPTPHCHWNSLRRFLSTVFEPPTPCASWRLTKALERKWNQEHSVAFNHISKLNGKKGNMGEPAAIAAASTCPPCNGLFTLTGK